MSDPASQNSIAGMGWYDCHSQFLGGAGIGPPGTVPNFIDLNCARNRPVANPHPKLSPSTPPHPHPHLGFTLTPSPPPSTSPEPGTCSYWADGTSAIMMTYDGKVIGNEVMPTLGIVKMLGEQPIRLLVPESP